MAQYPNQPPQGQPPYQGQGQQPPYGQPQPPYQGQGQPPYGQPQYQPQYSSPSQPSYQPQQDYAAQTQVVGQPQYQPQYQPQPAPINPMAAFTAPARSVPFSPQNAVGVFLSYIFLMLGGALPILTLYSTAAIYGISGGTTDVNFNFEGLVPLAGALVVFLVEKGNGFVRFHAAQALVFSIAWIILEFIIGLLEGVSALYRVMVYLNQILFVAYAFIIAYLIYRAAFKSELYKLPIVGQLAQSMAGPATI